MLFSALLSELHMALKYTDISATFMASVSSRSAELAESAILAIFLNFPM